MKNTIEILSHSLASVENVRESPQEQLWKRFQRVRTAVSSSFTSPQSPDMNRDINAFSWSGVDKGITDIKGRIQSRQNSLSLSLEIKGTYVDQQMKFVTDEKGNCHTQSSPQLDLHISGIFTSKDGKKGLVEIVVDDNQIKHEAYWLETNDNTARLEQIIDSQGVVHNFEDLKSLPYDKSQLRIPGSFDNLPLFRRLY